ncbi:MAG: asparaginase [Rhizobiaceae bacterium]
MSNPLLVEVLRGGSVESAHRGAAVAVDGDGAVVWSVGDIEQPVFPRSAVKAIQALPLVESGAAASYGFGDRELALACSSHSGEPEHVGLARSMLTRAGIGDEALECGSHWPLNQDATVALARSGGVPGQLHNNCSGKHAGFLCTCVGSGIPTSGYVGLHHPLQALIRDTMQEVTGAVHDPATAGIDGCSIPTYAVPLRSLALGFARMVTGTGFGRERTKAARRLFAACMAEPFYVAGTGRACTKLMQAAPGRIFVKTGAEGVFCAAIPEQGVGIAVKCEDGTGRAAEVVVAEVLAHLLRADRDLSAALRELARPELKNWNGLKVGALRPTAFVS